MEKLLSIQQVSEITGLSTGTLYHWISQKRIPVVRFSARCVRFRLNDIERWLSGKVVTPEDTSGVDGSNTGSAVPKPGKERIDNGGSRENQTK